MRFVGLDGEAVVGDLFRNDSLGKLTDHRQLVAKVAVDHAEIAGQLDDRLAPLVRGDVTAVHVEGFGGFQSGVYQGAVLRIEGMVDAEELDPRHSAVTFYQYRSRAYSSQL